MLSLRIDPPQPSSFDLGRMVLHHITQIWSKPEPFLPSASDPTKLVYGKLDGLALKSRQRMVDARDQTVWFRGALASLKGGASLEDADGTILSKLVEVEESTASLVHQMDGLIQLLSDAGLHSKSVDVIFEARQALVELLDAISDFKWAWLEQQADADLAQGRTKAFSNVEDLIRDLNS